MIKKTHKHLYEQRLNVKKKIQNKFLNLIKLLFLSFSTDMSSTEYRNVQYRVPKWRICSVPRCAGTELS